MSKCRRNSRSGKGNRESKGARFKKECNLNTAILPVLNDENNNNFLVGKVGLS